MGVTAADIPPELYPNIIRNVSSIDKQAWLPRARGSDLRNCTLVCLFWAQECRRDLFTGRTIRVTSMKKAEGLRRLIMTTESKRLAPLVEMIGTVEVWHDLAQDHRSWHHILAPLVPRLPQEKLRSLHICGVVPTKFPRSKLRSPHWSVPRSVPPLTTPYLEVHLSKLHFASLSDVVRLVSQLPHARELYLDRLTWNKDDVHPPGRPRTAAELKRISLQKFELIGCQDNASLCLRLLGINVSDMGSLLQTLSRKDQEVITGIINGISNARRTISDLPGMYDVCITRYADENQFLVEIHIKHFEASTKIFDLELHFICSIEEPARSSMMPHSEVIGCILLSASANNSPECKLYASHSFWSCILQFPSLRGLILGPEGFGSDFMAAFSENHPELRRMNHGQLRYRRFVRASYVPRWFAVDPSSLISTGEGWNSGEDIARDLMKKLATNVI